MAPDQQKNTLPSDSADQIRAILRPLFDDGQRWLQAIAIDDWRKTRYAQQSSRRRSPPSGPSLQNITTNAEQLLGYLSKEITTQVSGAHEYHFIVRPERVCASAGHVAIIRPVLKINFSGEPRLNFHIWFHDHSNNDHLMYGWRLEGPEGSDTSHDYYHAQPLKRFGAEQSIYGMPNRFPEKFPTIPLPAIDVVELCLTAVLIACGKDALRTILRSNGNAHVREAARAFWGRLFSHRVNATQ